MSPHSVTVGKSEPRPDRGASPFPTTPDPWEWDPANADMFPELIVQPPDAHLAVPYRVPNVQAREEVLPEELRVRWAHLYNDPSCPTPLHSYHPWRWVSIPTHRDDRGEG